MKTCKCGNTIPKSIVIEGKKKNLQNRTKCLICVPFGSSQFRKKNLDEHRSRKARNSRDYYYKQKALGIDRIKIQRENRKQLVITTLGGKCQLCGYDKLNRNLAFHHLSDKEIKLDSRSFQRSWDKIIPELLKCVLVCHNCHGEIHAGIINQIIVDKLNNQVKKLLKTFNGTVAQRLEQGT